MIRAEAYGWRPPKRNKFGAVKVTIDGHTFDSKAEAKRYAELKLLEKAGKIWGLTVHPEFRLAVYGVEIARYTADFSYGPKASVALVVEDVKSPPTAAKRDFKIICKLMKAVHGIDVQVIGGKPSSRPSMRAGAPDTAA